MSWFNSNWTRRAPITVNGSAVAAGSKDVTIVLPSDWDEFWDNVQSSGDDVRVCDADGRTALTYDLAGFNSATKTGTVEVDNWTMSQSNEMHVLWIYWDYPSATDSKTPFTPSAALAGDVTPERPGFPTFRARPQKSGATTVVDTVSKTTLETIFVWLELPDMVRRCGNFNNRDSWEEVESINVTVERGDSEEASLFDETDTRMVECAIRGFRQFIRVAIKGGTATNNYVCIVTITTDQRRVIDRRFQIKVNDAAEES